MSTWITEDFLLHTSTARRLYHEVAEELPIIDYHCHLAPSEIASNRRFGNLFEAWLEGDHYKWRAMRTNGISEEFCTGSAEPYEKFLAFARTVPKALRNPLYHWTHLELRRYFGIKELLNEESAPRIWQQANEMLVSEEFRVHGLLKKCRVEVVCTTDDPADGLDYHQEIAAGVSGIRVLPTFRPDKALAADQPEIWNAYLKKLETRSAVKCDSLEGLLKALKTRHEAFHATGGRLSDHGLSRCPMGKGDMEAANHAFSKSREGAVPSSLEVEEFRTVLMLEFGRWDAAQNWTKQLHLGAMRNNNTRLFRKLGPDTGFDSIGDYPQAESLSRYLDALDITNELPKTILYNLNPADNYLMATMIGNFQDGTQAGKIQFGSGWWFLDQKEGMEWQINALSNLGLLSRFVGMLTDSRSFLSYPRHEYFRRILCNLIGAEVERGEIPDDWNLLSELVEGVCYRNARSFFGF
ncbi:MAG: glucuronate isomerase [Candidatus Methylacidiphilales bacterium]